MKPLRFQSRKALLLLSFLLISMVQLHAQLQEPVKWSYKVNRLNDAEAELVFTAKIDAPWHLYSQNVPNDGPRPTLFTFDKNSGIELIGKPVETKPHEEFDPVFEMKVKYFVQQAVFKQKVKILSEKPLKVTGEVEFQACDDKSCMFDTKPFSFNLEEAKNAIAENTAATTTNTAKTVKADTVKVTGASSATNTATIQQTKTKSKSSLWWFFWAAFGGGLIAILTPCVFPMIPMTVSYFMKSGKKGKTQALLYGAFIIGIYTLFGTIMAVLFGAEFGNWLSTHWIPNVLFFIIFVVFAASFFGYFEITMPSWLVNKSVAAEDKGGIIGILFMAVTMVLVSFSCTGPIVGTVLVESVGGHIVKPIIGMLGFSLAFAIPFTLFALFPQWLEKMPKSGGWLNSVKVVLGFIELAFALKFLNVPDQTYHWGILDREVYLGFWIVIFAMMAFYLIGKIKFPHDSDQPYIKSFPRLLLAVFTFTFVVYLIPGLWGAPLKAISGWLPPPETQDFDISSIVRENGGTAAIASGNITETPKYADKGLKLPLGLKGYFDYDQALKAAKELNKPLFVDFTGEACTNCREMENRVWSDSEVLKRLRENFVIASLYVDDKTIEMPQNEWYTNKDGRLVKLLGKKNTEIQIKKFNANAQPYYVILDTDGNLLIEPHAHDLNIQNYIKFLDSGVEAFKAKQPKP